MVKTPWAGVGTWGRAPMSATVHSVEVIEFQLQACRTAAVPELEHHFREKKEKERKLMWLFPSSAVSYYK